LDEPVPAARLLPAHDLLGHPFTEPDEHVLEQLLEALKEL
jgi:hypothetical protein